MSRGYRFSRAVLGFQPIGVALLATALALLVACTGGGSTASRTPTATPTGSGNGQNPSATPQTISTAGAPQGIAGLCALPVSVSAQPPADIPAYPGAQLHVGSDQNGSGLFGYCSTAAVTDVNSFYTTKIPESGWKNVSSSAIGGTDQIMAAKGSTTLTITILTDGQVSGDTDIIIVTGTSGG